MAEYGLTELGQLILRKSDNVYIPIGDKANKSCSDYEEYAEWLAAGGVPDPFVALVVSNVDKRKDAYPDIGDQLDAMWKGGAEADAMKALVNKVKSDYPKE